MIWSTLRGATTESLVYSTLNAYGGARGGELCGGWFVAALAQLGRGAAAVRQALFRMVRHLELEARPAGRRVFYRLSPFGQAGVDAGTEKIFAAPERGWDGRWTLVHYQFAAGERLLRSRVRELLEIEGFAALAPGLYLHPRDRGERVRSALAQASPAEAARAVTIFRADRVHGDEDARLVASLWDLQGLDRRYRAFLDTFTPVLERREVAREPADAFRVRLAVVIAYLDIAWSDPELPDSLLPAGWSGHDARALIAKLYRILLPGTLKFGDQWQHLNQGKAAS